MCMFIVSHATVCFCMFLVGYPQTPEPVIPLVDWQNWPILCWRAVKHQSINKKRWSILQSNKADRPATRVGGRCSTKRCGHILIENEIEALYRRWVERRRRENQGAEGWGMEGVLPAESRPPTILVDFERVKRCWWHLRCQPGNI